MDEQHIENITVPAYKKFIKMKVREAAFHELRAKQSQRKKTHDILYINLKSPQGYLTSPKFSNEMRSILYNLRCQTIPTFKINFHTFYKQNVNCNLCEDGVEDRQEHALECPSILKHIHVSDSVQYEHIFGSIEEQEAITILFIRVLNVRDVLLSGNIPANRGSDSTGPTVLSII